MKTFMKESVLERENVKFAVRTAADGQMKYQYFRSELSEDISANGNHLASA